MDYVRWEPLYFKILKDFDFSNECDEKAAVLLDRLMDACSNPIDSLENTIKNSNVVIFGAGPSLKKAISHHKIFLENKIIITADGATSALLESDLLPDIIVTDLDGKVSDQIVANSKGSLVVIHAHGNNIDKLKKYVQKFKGTVIGTTQTNPQPFKNLYNFGGFTDGDRAIFLADHFSANTIYLAGFDFNGEIGKYSFGRNKDKKIKLKKLEWCNYLINNIQKNNSNVHFL